MIFVITDKIAEKLATQQEIWLDTYCKPRPDEICQRCKHNGEAHRVAAWRSEYQSPCSELVGECGTTSLESEYGAVEITRLDDACKCEDFVFADKKKQARHMRLMRQEKKRRGFRGV